MKYFKYAACFGYKKDVLFEIKCDLNKQHRYLVGSTLELLAQVQQLLPFVVTQGKNFRSQ